LKGWEVERIAGIAAGSGLTSVDQNGFALIPAAFKAEEIEVLQRSLAALDHKPSRAGIRHLLGHAAVSQVANDPRLLGIAQSVLGADAFPFRATLFDKSPDTNWLITWHQDTALPLRNKHETPGWGPWSVKEGVTYAHAPALVLEKVVALRLHLDDSTSANGPLRVLPGTHRNGVLTDQQVEVAVATTDAITCLVPQGGVIVMRPLIIHASSKSESTIPRRVLHIEYATPASVPSPLQLTIA
jgi:ectoine hydroxylase-related dioxygenase (phytanoyl-CoA dioxygenase family)